MDTEIQGSRILLRAFASQDAEDVFAYASNPLVSQYLDWEPHQSVADSEQFIADSLADQSGSLFRFAVQHIDTGCVIGSFEIRVVDSVHRLGELGFALAPEYWGQRYNLEAGELLIDFGFADLHLLRIQGLCDVENRRSARTMEKLGMVRERVLPKDRFCKGHWIDRYLYGVLWREWARRQARAGHGPGRSPE